MSSDIPRFSIYRLHSIRVGVARLRLTLSIWHRRKLFSSAFLASFLLPGSALAYVEATSDLLLSNLTFSFSDPGAKVVWVDDWYGLARAQAQDTSTGAVGDEADFLGESGTVTRQATTEDVKSSATAAVGDAATPVPPVSAATESELELLEPKEQGDGSAYARFDNFFQIVNANDGELDGATELTISLDYSGSLYGKADAFGFFSIGLRGLLQVFGLDGETLASTLLKDPDTLSVPLHSGSNAKFEKTYEDTLTVVLPVTYKTTYFLVAEADSEVFGANAVPEPGLVSLLGIVAIAAVSWRRRAA